MPSSLSTVQGSRQRAAVSARLMEAIIQSAGPHDSPTEEQILSLILDELSQPGHSRTAPWRKER